MLIVRSVFYAKRLKLIFLKEAENDDRNDTTTTTTTTTIFG